MIDEEEEEEPRIANLVLNNARISATISTISSLFIMIAIQRSQLKLKRIYNRIMLGVSTMDIISSIAIAFTTLPIPASYTEFSTILPGASGNIVTCNIQGFVVTVGYIGSMLYFVFLTFYYLCRIQFHMSEEKFQKRFELILHFLCISGPLVVSVSFDCER